MATKEIPESSLYARPKARAPLTDQRVTRVRNDGRKFPSGKKKVTRRTLGECIHLTDSVGDERGLKFRGASGPE